MQNSRIAEYRTSEIDGEEIDTEGDSSFLPRNQQTDSGCSTRALNIIDSIRMDSHVSSPAIESRRCQGGSGVHRQFGQLKKRLRREGEREKERERERERERYRLPFPSER